MRLSFLPAIGYVDSDKKENQVVKKILMITLLLVTMMAPLSAAAQTMDEYMGPAESVEAVYDALIAHQDLAGALALFADNAVLVIVPGPRGTDGVFVGRDAIRGWYEGDWSGDRTVFSNVEERGNSAAFTLSYWTDGLVERGTAPYVYDGTSVAQNGQIKSLTYVMTPETLAKRAAYNVKAANEELAHRFLEEMWDQGNMETAEEILADDFVDHYPRPGNEADKAGLMADAAGYHENGLKSRIDDLMVTEDMIILRVTVAPAAEAAEVTEGLEAAIFLGVADGQITDRRIAVFGWGE